MKLVMIGSGNVATVLSRLVKNAGFEIMQVYSRHAENAGKLATELGCSATDQLSGINKGADLYLVAVADSAFQDLNQACDFGDKLVVHTAGSIPKQALQNTSVNYGVLYPLQSLRKEKLQLYEDIPLLIDGSSEEVISLIEQFALALSQTVHRATDEQRLRLHLAAVVVNNFTNHMYSLAADYCAKTGVSFKLLQPLIEETALRLRDYDPANMQTGPAARKDITTLDKHLKELAAYPRLKNVYLKMSDSIMNSDHL